MQNIYEATLLSQSAPNIRGLVRGLSVFLDQIADTEKSDTTYLCEHPIVTLFLAQLVSLNHQGTIDLDVYQKAATLCEQRAATFEADQASRKTG